MKNFLTQACIVLIIICTGLFAFTHSGGNKQSSLGAGGINTFVPVMNVSTSVLASSTASTLILATSTARVYAVFGNLGANDIFLALTGGGPASNKNGIRIPAGGSYEITDRNLYYGAVYAMASTTSATTSVAAAQ